MWQMYLHEQSLQIRSKLLYDILSSYATKGESASLTGMCQVVESSRKICVTNKSAGCSTRKVRERKSRMTSIGSVDKSEC